MIALPLIVTFAASSMSAPRSEMRVDASLLPVKQLRIVFPDTKDGRIAQASYKAHATKGEIPGPGAGGAYAIGPIPGGIAVETRLSFGDRILPAPVPVTRQGDHLVLHFDWCWERQRPHRYRGFPVINTHLGLFTVQWLIHDIPDANYQISFQDADIGTCPES